MRSRHPSRQRLQRWLDTGETRRVESHLDACEQCQSILEELSELDERVVAGLQTAITPPDDLGDRTNLGVDERLRNEAVAGAFLELFTIGWDVVHTILDPATQRETTHEASEQADQTSGGQR